MHCSFNINNNNESLQLIYNEEKIYIKIQDEDLIT